MSFKIDVSALSKKELEELKRQLQEKIAQKQQEFTDSEPRLEQFFDPENFRKNHENWRKDRDIWLSFLDNLGDAIDAELNRDAKENDEGLKLLVGSAKDWEGKKIAEVFIDDILEYAENQQGKSLLDSLTRIYNEVDENEISKLPKKKQEIVRKRIEELRQLVDRGQRSVDAGHTKEYTDKVLRLTYDMSKDGLREALNFDITGIESDFPDVSIAHDDETQVDKDSLISKLGWFHSPNGIVKNLGGEEFHSFTEYLASKTKAEYFNTIIKANDEQGGYSYYDEPVCRKFAVLKAMGYDLNDFKDWETMKKTLQKDGFFVDFPDVFELQFNKLKADQTLYNAYYEGQSVFDAAIQLVLENTTITGNETDDKSMLLLRTESTDIAPPLVGENMNGRFYKKTGKKFYTGVCESHSHIDATYFEGDFLTVTSVPYSRIHALWFMEKAEIKQGRYTLNKYEPFQFWAPHQNEMDACTNGLPVIGVGNAVGMKKPRQQAIKAWKKWIKKNRKSQN